MAKRRGFWGVLVAQSASETQLLQPWRLWSGIGSAIGNPIVQYELGRVTLFSATVESIGIGIGVYFVLTAGEFLVRLCRMPSKIWNEQREALATQSEELNPEAAALHRHASALEEHTAAIERQGIETRMRDALQQVRKRGE